MGDHRQRLAPRHLAFTEDGPPSTPPRSGAVAEAAVITPVTPLVQYYGVAKGRCEGVYHSHAEVMEETRDYKSRVCRVCKSAQVAERFIDRYLDLTMGRRGDQSTLVAFCDAAVPGECHWSYHTGVVCLFPHIAGWNVIFTCQDMYCTVYRASMKAVLCAVQRANLEDPTQHRVVYIFTRNQLLVRAMTEWIDTWLANDGVKADGQPVKNKDVLRRLVETQSVASFGSCKMTGHPSGPSPLCLRPKTLPSVSTSCLVILSRSCFGCFGVVWCGLLVVMIFFSFFDNHVFSRSGKIDHHSHSCTPALSALAISDWLIPANQTPTTASTLSSSREEVSGDQNK